MKGSANMAEREEQLRKIAAAIIEDCGEDAYIWAMLRAAGFRKEGDDACAELWERVADTVLNIQAGPEKRGNH